MKRSWPLLAFLCASLVGFVALVSSAGLVYADANASTTTTIHNGDTLHRTAIDLHFLIRLWNWEGQNAGSPYWFKSWTITTNPALGGAQTTTPRVNPDGHIYAIAVDYTGINVAYCTTVRIDVSATLDKWNSLVIDSLYFTYATGNPTQGEPDEGFSFFPQYPIRVTTGQPHTTTYRLVNEDASVPFTVSNLRFYWADVWYPPETWTGSVGTLIYTVTGPIVVNPGSYFDVQLPVPWSPPGLTCIPSYIYVAGLKEYQMPGFDVPEARPFQNGHQEILLLEQPAIGTWGVVVLLAVLAATAVWLIRRRRVLGQA
jgi:hypothetical protein